VVRESGLFIHFFRRHVKLSEAASATSLKWATNDLDRVTGYFRLIRSPGSQWPGQWSRQDFPQSGAFTCCSGSVSLPRGLRSKRGCDSVSICPFHPRPRVGRDMPPTTYDLPFATYYLPPACSSNPRPRLRADMPPTTYHLPRVTYHLPSCLPAKNL